MRKELRVKGIRWSVSSLTLFFVASVLTACICRNLVNEAQTQDRLVTRTGPGLEVVGDDAAGGESEGSGPVSPALLAGSSPSAVISFRGREIDLAPHIRGFPFRSFHVDAGHSILLYIEKTARGDRLKMLRLDGDVDLAAGQTVNEVDWSTRSLWHYWTHIDDDTQRVFVMSDEANEERMNVYALSLVDGSIEQITDNDYTYGYGFSPDGKRMAYLARRGTTEPFNSCLMLFDFVSGLEREVRCDEGGADRFTWSDIHFQYGDSDDSSYDNIELTHALVTMQHDGDRNRENIARIDLRSGDMELLLERGAETFRLWVAENAVFRSRPRGSFRRGSSRPPRSSATAGRTAPAGL